jgi:transposase-like protein
LTTRRDAECAEAVPPAFGLAKSTISRRFIRASARKLHQLLTRALTPYEFVAVFLDGKTFGDDELVIALGITLEGEKLVLGFFQTGTENAAACTEFLQGLVDRGLQAAEVLWIIDGAKGFRAAIHQVVGGAEVVQRCQWHKRENVVSYLPKREQARWRKRLQDAYSQVTEAEARTALATLGRELARVNRSAAASLQEGLDETLTVLALGVGPLLRASLATTNCLASINATLEALTGKIDYWHVSDQKHRWVASALLDLEPRLNKVKGHRALPALRAAILARHAHLTPQTGEVSKSIRAEKDSSTGIVERFLEKVGAKSGSR